MSHKGYNNADNQPEYNYKYNGKELQEELGMNVTAMNFRQYDMALGRFMGMDRLSELSPHLTPYRFAFNNPTYWSDPSGLFETRKEAREYRRENSIQGDIRKNVDGSFRLDDMVNSVSYTKGDEGSGEYFKNDGVQESVIVLGGKVESDSKLGWANFVNDRIGDGVEILGITKNKGGSFGIWSKTLNDRSFDGVKYGARLDTILIIGKETNT